MHVAELQDRLAQRAFLHDDPEAYLAGVSDALAVVSDAADDVEDQTERRGA
jgi:hypothetical protein